MIPPVPARPRRATTAAPLAAALAALLALAAPGGAPAAEAARRASSGRSRPIRASSQSRWRQAHYTEDWRWGTDITDSTSRGGWDRGREGKRWDISGGETLRWKPLRRLLGWRGPWQRYQLGIPVGATRCSTAPRRAINADYQFGGSLDLLWRGRWDDASGIAAGRARWSPRAPCSSTAARTWATST